jgi:hypothetical protein
MSEKKPRCPGCRQAAIKEPIKVCKVCNRELVAASRVGRGSKNKGSSFERLIATAFSEWWGEEKSFRRTPMSGGWDRNRACGDLITPEGFPFTVEMKNFEAWDILHLITSEKSVLGQHWKQTLNETAPGKLPLLIFTRNHQPTFYMMRLCDHADVVTPLQDAGELPPESHYLITDDGRTIGLFDDLLKEWRCPK